MMCSCMRPEVTSGVSYHLVLCWALDLDNSQASWSQWVVWMEEVLLLIMCTRICKRPSSGISQSHLCPHAVGGLLLSPATPVLLCVVAVEVVEVFNSETAQWYTGAPLPVACVYMQLTIINDTCYLGGGGIFSSTGSIMCASLPSLFQSSSPREQQTSAQQQSEWTMLPDMPLCGSALASMGGALLALGGCESTSSPPSDVIHAYSASTKAWVKIASLPQECSSYHCRAAAIW